MGCAGSKKNEFADRKPVGRNLTKDLAQRSLNKDDIQEIKPSATSSSSSAPAHANGIRKDGGEKGNNQGQNDKESKPLIQAQDEVASSQSREEKALKKNADEETLKKAQEEKDKLFAAQAAQQDKLKELEEKRRLMQEAAAEKQRLKEEATARDREELQKRREALTEAERERELKKKEQDEARRVAAEAKAHAAKLELGKNAAEKNAAWEDATEENAAEEKRLADGVGYTKAEFFEYFGEVDGAEKWEHATPPLVETAQAAGQLEKPQETLAPPSVSIHGGSLEEDVVKWLEIVSGESKGELSYMEWLKDGKLLCKVVNNIEPNIVPRINQQSMPFKQMENIANFAKACRKLGVLEKDVFSTVDLYEDKNPKGVLICILNLGGVVRQTAPSFSGPYLGKQSSNLVTDCAREKVAVTGLGTSGYRPDIKQQLREGVNCWNQEEIAPERE